MIQVHVSLALQPKGFFVWSPDYFTQEVKEGYSPGCVFMQQTTFHCVNGWKGQRPAGMQLRVLYVGVSADIVCIEELALSHLYSP